MMAHVVCRVEMEESDGDLVKKPGTKSLVWDYFGVKVDTNGKPIDNTRAVCRSCRQTVLAKSGNTSNLMAHLRVNHSRIHSELQNAMKRKATASATPSSSSQCTLSESLERCQRYDRKGKKWIELTEAVTYYIAKDAVPIRTVEKSGFKKLVKKFDSRYELPSRKYFSQRALPNLYTSVKEKLMKDLSSVRFYSATTDLWSSSGMTPYISYTVHYIDKEWFLQSKCLQTQFIPEDHTGENLAEAMKATLESWNLDSSNQVCLTTDSGSNVIKAAEDLNWPRLSCFGHNLHLAITKALKDDTRCTRALGVARKIVSSISSSWKRRREFTKAQINLGLQQHALITDCTTRWGSMAQMVKRILEQEEAIRVTLSSDRKTSHLVPTWQDIEVLQAIDKALSPLSSLTDILSADLYVTVSAVNPLLQLIEKKFLTEDSTDTQLTKDIKKRVKEDLITRYSRYGDEIKTILKTATLLDPRFKAKYLNDMEVEDMKEYLRENACDSEESDCQSSSHSAESPPPAKKKEKSRNIV